MTMTSWSERNEQAASPAVLWIGVGIWVIAAQLPGEGGARCNAG
jgi:hypothetical protein